MLAKTPHLWPSSTALRAVTATVISFALMPAATCVAQVSGDFNDDGFADLAIGVPGENVGDPDAGAVSVLYGSAGGLTATGDQFWHQDSLDIAGDSSPGDRFGAALAVGDFNGDGIDDLAIGVPGDEVSGNDDAGGLTILFGTGSGLISGNNQQINLSYAEMPFDLANGDQFGSAFASGDFDNDGFDDLAVGVPGQGGAGAIVVLFGTAAGLDTFSSIGITQDTTGIADTPEAGDRFGASLASGRFDDDDFDDLAIGAPGEDAAGIADAGGVHVLYGGFNGPDPGDSQFWSQDSSNIKDQAESGDNFGAAVASGDFDADGFDDLAIGAPNENLGTSNQINNAGIVHLFFGRDIGLRPAGNRTVSQSSSSGSSAESGDRFGAALAFGDFDGDLRDDLLVGSPGESLQDIGSGQDVQRGGAAFIVSGNALRLMSFASSPLRQNGAGGLNQPRANDHFGSALATGDFNGDGRDDAAVSIPKKNVSVADAGAVGTYHGADNAAMLEPVAGGVWTQNSPGVANSAGDDDQFGGGNGAE